MRDRIVLGSYLHVFAVRFRIQRMCLFSESDSSFALEWLSEKGIIKTEPISSLSGRQLGIDGHTVLRTLRCNEVNQVATGGVPITLKRSILAEAEHFKYAPISFLRKIACKDRRRAHWLLLMRSTAIFVFTPHDALF